MSLDRLASWNKPPSEGANYCGGLQLNSDDDDDDHFCDNKEEDDRKPAALDLGPVRAAGASTITTMTDWEAVATTTTTTTTEASTDHMASEPSPACASASSESTTSTTAAKTKAASWSFTLRDDHPDDSSYNDGDDDEDYDPAAPKAKRTSGAAARRRPSKGASRKQKNTATTQPPPDQHDGRGAADDEAELPVSLPSRDTVPSNREPKRRRVQQARERLASAFESYQGTQQARRGRSAASGPAAQPRRPGLRSDEERLAGRPAKPQQHSASQEDANIDDDADGTLLDERLDDNIDGNVYDNDQEPSHSTNKRDVATQYPVFVKDPERRDIAALLSAAVLGPGDDKNAVADTYRETLTDLLRRGCLYVLVNGAERRIPFSDEHAYRRGEALGRCWINKDNKCHLRLKGNPWSHVPPITFRIYADKAAVQNVASVTWNGRHFSASAELEFTEGQVSNPTTRSRAPVAAAAAVPEAVASSSAAASSTAPRGRASAKRSVRALQPPQQKSDKPKRGRPPSSSTRVAATKGRRGATSTNCKCGGASSYATAEIIVIDSDSDDDKDEVVQPPASDAPLTATNNARASAVAPILRGSARVKEEPNPRQVASPNEVVLVSEDGTALVSEFQRRVDEFLQKIATERNVDLATLRKHVDPGYVYEKTMEGLLKEGRVHVPANGQRETAAVKLFSRKVMPSSMLTTGIFKERVSKGNRHELRLPERTDSAGISVIPRIIIGTSEQDKDVIESITWNGLHLTIESEIECLFAS
jgi:hypothetical protein